MANPDDKKISQLPENPVVLDTDDFSTITPRTDGTAGFENVKTPGWKVKDYVNTDPRVKGIATYQSGDRAHPSITHEADTDTGIHFPSEDTMSLGTAGVETITIDPHNNTILGPQELVLNDSRDGFVYLPTMDGSPRALPRQIADKTPIIIDRINNIAFIFTSGAWRPLSGSGGGGGGGAIIPTPVTRLDALDDVKATGASRPSNGDALVYDTASNSWKPARSGLEITIRPDRRTAYPNPATLPVGHLILTIENGLKEIAVIDAAHRITVLYSDSELATKIAASSLFQGVKPDKIELAKLPAPAPTNKGFYWTWTGPASTPLVPADFPNGGGFTATLQVGDWIQSDGTKFVHVPSDLMSKLRWKAVGSFQTWTDTNYEIDTLVVHKGRFYRATAAIITGDAAPDVGGSWVDITPNYNLSNLLDVDLTTPPSTGDALVFDGAKWVAKRSVPNGTNDGDVLSWDATLNGWVTAADYLGDEENVTLGADPNLGVPVYDNANNTFEIRRLNLEELADCQQLSFTADGEVPAWSVVNNRWEPVKVSASFANLTDVSLTGTANDQIIKYDAATNTWINWTPDYLNPTNGYTKTEVDSKLTTLISGVQHGLSVIAIAETPPATNKIADIYIVGLNPTGVWAGHKNELALWNGTDWEFSPPRDKAAHLVEDQAATYAWNGTAWVKVATAVSGGSSAQAGVGEIVSWIGDTFPTSDYLECKGQVVAIGTYTDLHNVIGNKYNPGTAADGTSTFALPDLRGYFLRGDKAGLNVGTARDWTTGLPKAGLTTNYQGSHAHSFKRSTGNFSGDGKYRDANFSSISATGAGESVGTGIEAAGNHAHGITGGDAETAPAHFVVKWLIRYKPINGGAIGATGPKGDGASPGDVMQVGSVQQSMLTENQFATVLGPVEGSKWVLADGRNCTGTKYAQITGKTNLPDLRGAFLRSAGKNNNGKVSWDGGTAGSWFEDSTALPKRAFVISDSGNHDHGVGGLSGVFANAGGHDLVAGTSGSPEGTRVFAWSGNHSHNISGGDAQTAPVHVALNTFIKVN
jgi:microcystin-dependent protein